MNKKKIAIILILSFSIIIPLVAFSATFPNIYVGTRVAKTHTTAAFALELEQKLPNLMKKYRLFGGGAIALISNYELIWVGEFGYANEALETPITNGTFFQIASMSKSFCSWGVMKLYEDGLIDLDAPVDSYLTRWHLPDTGYNNSEVTIRRILSHTAGLSKPSFMGYANTNDLPTVEEALTAEVRVIAKPGSKWMYSGGGFLLLQLLIEEVSGQNYTNYMTNEILAPLNLTNARPDWTTDIQNFSAKAYTPFGKELPMYRFTALSAGGHYSTIIDLAKFVMTNMNGSAGEPPGRGVLNTSTIKLLQSKVADVHPLMGGYGLGFQTKLLANGQKMVYHNGQNTGFIGTMNFIPASGEGLVILTSCDAAKSLVVELESRWQQMIQGTAKNTVLFSKYLITVPAIIVLSMLFIGISIWLVVSVLKSKRQLVFQKSFPRTFTAVLLGVVLIVSMVLLYAPITYRSGFVFVYWFVPNIHWVALLLSLSLVYYLNLCLTLTKKVKRQTL